MNVSMLDEESINSSDYIILQRVDKDWKIIEIYGDGFLTKELFTTKYKDNMYAYDTVFWDFPKEIEVDYSADYNRLH